MSWARILLINALSTALAFSLSGGLSETTWSSAIRRLLISAVYAHTIGTAAGLLMPRLHARLQPRRRAVQVGLQLVTVLAVLGVGLITVPALLVLLGLIPAHEYVAHAVPVDWPAYAVPAMVIIAVGISLYEGMRRDLEAQLRTKERDEAIARRVATEAQLASLEARVHPHFFFNALNSVAALIPSDPGQAERMVRQVASLLRSSLNGDASLIALEDELRVVRDYLEVERVRFGDRLRYEVDIGEGAARARVPRLAVQTLVEDAVKYAVSPRRTGASLAVRASATDGVVRVEVHDDGPGFLEADVPDGHGLALVRSRLATLFEGRASLRIDSGPHGTRVVLQVPA